MGIVKYRLWDGERLRDVNSIGWTEGESDWVSTSKYNGDAEFVTFMQNSGLTDIEDKYIYEKDIVELQGNCMVVHKGMHSYNSIDSMFGGLDRQVYGYYLESPCGSWQLNIAVHLDELKIVGNIYEDNHLLNNK